MRARLGRAEVEEHIVMPAEIVVGDPRAIERLAEAERLIQKSLRDRAREYALDVHDCIHIFRLWYERKIQEASAQFQSAFAKGFYRLWQTLVDSLALRGLAAFAQPFVDRFNERVLDGNTRFDAQIQKLKELQAAYVALSSILRKAEYLPAIRRAGIAEELLRRKRACAPSWGSPSRRRS
jgi:hypothetical protein